MTGGRVVRPLHFDVSSLPTTTTDANIPSMPASTNSSAAPGLDEALPDTLFDTETCKDRGFCLVNTDHPNPPHRIYYEVHGGGDIKVLFIMGLKNCSFSWSRQVDALSRNPAYSVLVFDNRGAGYSDTPRGPYTTGGMAGDTIHLMDHIGWVKEREVHVVGVSMGGMIALKLAVLEPLRIASLLLAVTTAGHGLRRKLPPLDGLELTARTLFENEIERYMLMLYPQSWLDEIDEDDPDGRTNRETRIEEHNRRVKMTPGQTVLGQWWQLAAATTHRVSTEQLRRINSEIPKICILSAKNDTLIPPDSSLNLSKHMVDAELVQWNESGHAIHSQFPARFNELCERVIKEGRAASGPPRLWRTDSLRLIRSKEDDPATSSPTSFYPRGLADVIERYWSTSATPSSSPHSVGLPNQEEAEAEKKQTPSHLRIPADTGSALSSKVVSFKDPEPSEEASGPPRHAGLRELVERVMRDNRDEPEDGDASLSPTSSSSRPHRFQGLVERVLTPRKPTPSSLALPSSPSTEHPSFFNLGIGRRSKSRDVSPVRKARARRASELPERLKSEESDTSRAAVGEGNGSLSFSPLE